jgi:signal peptidase
MSKFRQLLRNEYVKSVIFLAVILIAIAGFWFGLRAYLRTDYPLLAVASGSMVPTLNVGDLIVVQGGLAADEISAEVGTGDVIIFYRPSDANELIVHRAVEKHADGETWYFKTKGDHNPSTDYWKVYERDIVGKVVGVVPYIGHIPLFVHTQQGMLIIVILIIALVVLEFVVPFVQKKTKPEPTPSDSEAQTPGNGVPEI